jgi:hypothetical protein
MSGFPFALSLQTRSSEPVDSVTLASTTDLSSLRARRACPPEGVPA